MQILTWKFITLLLRDCNLRFPGRMQRWGAGVSLSGIRIYPHFTCLIHDHTYSELSQHLVHVILLITYIDCWAFFNYWFVFRLGIVATQLQSDRVRVLYHAEDICHSVLYGSDCKTIIWFNGITGVEMETPIVCKNGQSCKESFRLSLWGSLPYLRFSSVFVQIRCRRF